MGHLRLSLSVKAFLDHTDCPPSGADINPLGDTGTPHESTH
jgi:hypothetical protein